MKTVLFICKSNIGRSQMTATNVAKVAAAVATSDDEA